MSRYNPTNCPGPGDEATWPAYSGHPNDPRAPDDELDWDAMTHGQKVAQLLNDFSAQELADLYVDALDDIETLTRRVKRLEEPK